MAKEEIYNRQDLINVQKMINKLREDYDTIVERKKEIETRLSILNSKVRSSGNMPPTEYKNICRNQSDIKQELVDLQPQINHIKHEIADKEIFKEEIYDYINKNKPKDIVAKLEALRDSYMEFASDQTRVGSTRVMASRFTEELQEIINSLNK